MSAPPVRIQRKSAHAVQIVRSVGLDVEDGLAFTFSCADYPDWLRDMNGWPVEDAAEKIAAHWSSHDTP
jgi:hypothetical protein